MVDRPSKHHVVAREELRGDGLGENAMVLHEEADAFSYLGSRAVVSAAVCRCRASSIASPCWVVAPFIGRSHVAFLGSSSSLHFFSQSHEERNVMHRIHEDRPARRARGPLTRRMRSGVRAAPPDQPGLDGGEVRGPASTRTRRAREAASVQQRTSIRRGLLRLTAWRSAAAVASIGASRPWGASVRGAVRSNASLDPGIHQRGLLRPLSTLKPRFDFALQDKKSGVLRHAAKDDELRPDLRQTMPRS